MQKYLLLEGGREGEDKQRVSMQASILGFLGVFCSQPEQESICQSYGCLENTCSFRSVAIAS